MLKIGLVQTELAWEDILENLNSIAYKVFRFKQEADIILLPELFTTGFTMKSKEFAVAMDSNAVGWMKDMARTADAVIGGSMIIHDEGKYVNRFLWIYPDGRLAYYDKKHLFRMGEENRHFTAGDSIQVVEHKKWRIRLNICYDLRFPVWSRNTGDYDLLIYIANWPESRRKVWTTLLRARAIENLCYVAGVNRIGKDGNGITYSGDSCIIDFKGSPLKLLPAHKESSSLVEIDLNKLNQFRNKFPVHLDADPFKLL